MDIVAGQTNLSILGGPCSSTAPAYLPLVTPDLPKIAPSCFAPSNRTSSDSRRAPGKMLVLDATGPTRRTLRTWTPETWTHDRRGQWMQCGGAQGPALQDQINRARSERLSLILEHRSVRKPLIPYLSPELGLIVTSRAPVAARPRRAPPLPCRPGTRSMRPRPRSEAAGHSTSRSVPRRRVVEPGLGRLCFAIVDYGARLSSGSPTCAPAPFNMR